VYFEPLKLAESIYAIDFGVGAADESMEIIHFCYVNTIERCIGSAMIHSDFTTFDDHPHRQCSGYQDGCWGM